jgi:hypothetical protein
VPSSGYVTRATSHCLPTARSAGNRVEAADGASFVVFIFLALFHLYIYFSLASEFTSLWQQVHRALLERPPASPRRERVSALSLSCWSSLSPFPGASDERVSAAEKEEGGRPSLNHKKRFARSLPKTGQRSRAWIERTDGLRADQRKIRAF